ncbi:MAG: hypothetical protein K2X81_28805, partial [Candidatus Obscuribacterales bacterium]|nr:hypothetical protein [Candidatus Obscuribacterales bacterium]
MKEPHWNCYAGTHYTLVRVVFGNSSRRKETYCMIFLGILSFITIAVALSQFYSFNRMHRYVSDEMAKPAPTYKPKLAVILPCKGLDTGFHDNMRKLLEQDYSKDGRSHFEVVFAVATEGDPAYPALKAVCEEFPHIACRVVLAGINPIRAQKLNN